MDARESEFVDRMGLAMERLGGTRTMGRLYAWLMICDPPHQSLTDLAAELGVSKTAISTVARQLETAGMLERVPTSNRQHRYRVVRGGWAQVLRVQLALLRPVVEVLDFGLSVIGDELPEQRARLEETKEFFAFTERDGDEMLQRWEEYHKSRRASAAEPELTC
ncbi:MarR family transcriptional regulator [Nonomuraea sp. NPDC000554]|uniref:GbsR/MarR family transcriptional regulator n=1 Tax=Nonomuraea sp. NPDC000554 TaxID=3154259 RepID=UPI003324CE74